MSASPAQIALDAPAVRIGVETAFEAEAVDALVLGAFGPGRFAKTAERFREGVAPAVGFTAHEGGRLIGSVRLWNIAIDGLPALFLGPIAVSARARRAGVGAELVAACVDEARRRGASGVLLVGDPPYFSRFGFEAAPQVRLPGPVDRRRVMWLPMTVAAPEGLAVPA